MHRVRGCEHKVTLKDIVHETGHRTQPVANDAKGGTQPTLGHFCDMIRVGQYSIYIWGINTVVLHYHMQYIWVINTVLANPRYDA